MRSPGGLSRPAVWAISAVVVVLGAVILFAAREPLTDEARHWLSASFTTGPADASAVSLEGGGPESLSTVIDPPPKVVVPKAPTWSLVEVGDAVHGAIPKLQTLIAEGRSEVPSFKAMDSNRPQKAERAKRRWGAWGQIWKNRVAVVEATLPPPEACRVHAAMEPACRTIREATTTLGSVPDDPDLKIAMERFEDTEQILDLLLNPPELELPVEKQVEDGEAPSSENDS